MKRVLLALVLLVICAPILAADTRYEVKDHDTLAGILRQLGYGETYAELLPFIEQIVEMNRDVLRNDNADFLFPGSVLTLPKNPNEPEPEPEPVAEPEPIPEPEPEPEPAIASIGSVQISSGTAEIKRENETIAVAQKEELFESDIIITRDESVAEITLADNTRISVGPNSEFSINEYSYAVPADSSGDVLGSLVASIRRGVIRTITGLIGKLQSNRFEIKSALSATIGIRGTDFTVRTCTQASTCGDLYGVSVGVRDGNISFKNESAEIELAPNEFAQVQSASETPLKVPLPEGFFDLKRDITEIAVDKSWWERSIDYLKTLAD